MHPFPKFKLREISDQEQLHLSIIAILLSVYNANINKYSGQTVSSTWESFQKQFGTNLCQNWKFGRIYPSSVFSFTEIANFFDKVISLNLWDPFKFDFKRNRENRQNMNGDYTWIFGDIVLALATPQSNIPFNYTISESIPKGSSNSDCILFENLVQFLCQNKIEALFRFNNLLYDDQFIQGKGIDTYGMEYPDGHFPSDAQIDEFLKNSSK
jgi:hypothetical protein